MERLLLTSRGKVSAQCHGIVGSDPTARCSGKHISFVRSRCDKGDIEPNGYG